MMRINQGLDCASRTPLRIDTIEFFVDSNGVGRSF